MAKINSALIAGAGIGGLAAGARLAQLGVETQIVELKDEARVYGVGINQPGNALRALDDIGVLEEVLTAGFQFSSWIFHDHLGNVIVDVSSRLGGDHIPPNCALPRRDLHTILIGAAERAGVGVRYGTAITELEDLGDRVAVEFSDGNWGEYDLVVGFDGINSEMRERLFGDSYRPTYTGHAAWRVTVPRPPEADNGALYQSAVHKAGHIPLSDDLMYLLLVSAEPEGARYPKDQLASLLREHLLEFEGLIGEIRDNLSDDDDIVFSPLSEVMLPMPWHRGRVATGGDAAHACTPHMAQGAAMALEDAIVLADAIANEPTVESALDVYSTRRYPRARFVQQASRGILDAEMSVTEESLPRALEAMAVEVPAQFGQVDEFLNQPA